MAAIVCDGRERGAHIRVRLAELGVGVEVANLAAGHYAIGRTVLVERKTVRDLHLTIATGRFWFQLGRLRLGAVDPYLLVEGADLDDGPLRPNAVRGCLVAAIDLDVHLLRSTDLEDSARSLARLHARHGADRPRLQRPVYAQRPKPRSPTLASEAALAAIPGISHRLAIALLEHFGTLRAVLNAEPDEWTDVRGIGPAKAAALAAAVATEHGRMGRTK